MFGLDSDFGQQTANSGLGGLPQININGFSSIGQNFAPKSTNDTWNPATNWILHTGMHRLKFGAEAHVVRATGFDPGLFSPLGTFTFGAGPTFSPTGTTSQFLNTSLNSFASFLLGAPTQAGVANFYDDAHLAADALCRLCHRYGESLAEAVPGVRRAL